MFFLFSNLVELVKKMSVSINGIHANNALFKKRISQIAEISNNLSS